MMLVRDDVAQRRRKGLEQFSVTSGRIELMVLEIRINAEKWLLVNMYKQPKVRNNCLTNVLVTLLDQVMYETNNVILFGDLNVNLLELNNCLSEIFSSHGEKTWSAHRHAIKVKLKPL